MQNIRLCVSLAAALWAAPLPAQVDPSAKPAPPAPKVEPLPAGRLEGMYAVTVLNVFSKPVSYYQRHYLFFRDGRVYHGFPKDGNVAGFDFAAAEKAEPAKCGTYEIADGKINFVVPGAERPAWRQYSEPFKMNEDGSRIDIRGSKGFKVVPLPAGYKLDGLYYALISRATISLNQNDTGDAGTSSRAYSFSRGKAVAALSGEGGRAETKSIKAGDIVFTISKLAIDQYCITGHTLLMKREGKAPDVDFFYLLPEEVGSETPSCVFINGYKLLRQAEKK